MGVIATKELADQQGLKSAQPNKRTHTQLEDKDTPSHQQRLQMEMEKCGLDKTGAVLDSKKYMTCHVQLCLSCRMLILTLLVDRAQWFRAWQEKLRCDEAINCLCTDFRAAIKGFSEMGNRWLEASKAPGLEDGECAYTRQCHHIFQFKSAQCQEAYNATREAGIPADQLDHTLVRNLLYYC